MVPPRHRFSCYVGGTCGDGNGPPLRFSCLENPMGGGGWWAEQLHFHFLLSCIEGNGNPLQCSCLENPRDGGAWWAAVYGVAQSRTRLKWLSSSRRHMLQYCSPFNIPERKMYSFSPSTLPVTFTTVFLLSPKPCFVLL